VIEIHDLTDTPGDQTLLTTFYDGLYLANFPKADERESLASMRRYLKLKHQGWYGSNNYHVALMKDGERIVAASVSDYLSDVNFGVIEFMVVDEDNRGRGLGRLMHEATLALLNEDARNAGRCGLDANIIELNDPFRVSAKADNFDPIARVLTWDRLGYGRLRFRYTQPALSRELKPVDCLILAVKTFTEALAEALPAQLVVEFLECYLVWAMRIPVPQTNSTFRAMARSLAEIDRVAIEPLAVYVGYQASRPLDVREAEDQADQNFTSAVDVYNRVFQPSSSTVDPIAFAHSLERVRGQKHLHYHFWALAERPGEPAHGMSAFFVMRRFGFCGYIAMEPPLAGRGLLRVLLKRIEEQMIRDEPEAREWYIECDPDSVQQRIFERLGFARVPVCYHQPPLDGNIDARAVGLGPKLVLMRKEFGEEFEPWKFSLRRFRPVLSQILSDVYRIPNPQRSASLRTADGELS
jgi:GNAT superfamily N-acetyltransferase